MQVTVETLEGLERSLNITVPAANIEDAVTAELRNIAKNRRFDGFRKGKVPLKMVAKMYGKAVVLRSIGGQTYGFTTRVRGHSSRDLSLSSLAQAHRARNLLLLERD